MVLTWTLNFTEILLLITIQTSNVITNLRITELQVIHGEINKHFTLNDVYY